MKLSKIALACAATLALLPGVVAPDVASAAPKVSASTASSKPVGQKTSIWGTASGAPNAQVWTEVKIGSKWSKSQTSKTNSKGYYSIALTYGAKKAGTTTWRVGVKTARGTVYSGSKTLKRVGPVTANSAKSKQAGQAANVWGYVPAASGSRVFTQVHANGKWSTSQAGKVSSKGTYTLPLTYGRNTPGTHTYRVGVSTSAGVMYSSSFKQTRTAGISGTCKASYYTYGSRTANGESYNPNGLTAAHRTLPFGTRVLVKNKANGKTVTVRINDRGPFISGRCLDLSGGAMRAVGGVSSGVINVDYTILK